MIPDQRMRFEDRHILLGVTGSIAAYKACEILRRLQKEGAEVRVVMTEAAQKFVAPLTFETLSRHEVVKEMFPAHRMIKTRHVSLVDWADVVLICPATANIIGKIAGGIADDFLTTAVMASRCPVIIAPAMDYQMVRNVFYLENCTKLEANGYRFVPTEEGELASGASGPGRLAEYDRIIDVVDSILWGSESLKGVRVLVSAGPTREAIDPVRFITNHSSGKMGIAVAEEAALRGADVMLICGPTNLRVSSSVRVRRTTSAADMHDAVIEAWKNHDVLVMAAAVADYRPLQTHPHKLKKELDMLTLSLERTDDILASASSVKGDRIVVGFALETEDGSARAKQKLEKKNLDLICLNNPLDEGAGFGEESNVLTLIDRDGNEDALARMSKREAAKKILDRVEDFLKGRA